MDLDELERLLKSATAAPWLMDWESSGAEIFGADGFWLMTMDRRVEELKANVALIVSLRNLGVDLIRDARACAEIRRVIALGRDDGSVGRVARRALAKEAS